MTYAGSRLIGENNLRELWLPEKPGSTTLHSLQFNTIDSRAGHDCGQYLRDAKNAGLADIAAFFEKVVAQGSDRGQKRRGVLKDGSRGLIDRVC